MAERRLEQMPREERVALCREVMERLSELVEGEAPAEFCERYADLLEECQPFRAYRNTLEQTIRLAGELGSNGSAPISLQERSVAECIEKVRRRVAGQTNSSE